MRWFTCTTKPFVADKSFFYRDSGLYASALVSCGVESKTVLPLPWHEGDYRDRVIRGSMQELSSAKWWRQWGLDGVVLYSWGLPEYTPIIRAIKESGIRVVLIIDGSGQLYPWACDFVELTKHYLRLNVLNRGVLLGVARTLLQVADAFTAKWLRRDLPFRKHVQYADVIGMPTHLAVRHYRKYPWLMRAEDEAKMQVMYAPVGEHFCYDGTPKERRVVVASRWDDKLQKRPRFVLEMLGEVLRRDATVCCDLIGKPSQEVLDWYGLLPTEQQERVCLHGAISSAQVAGVYSRARVAVCASYWEGTHLSSLEALCCGASIVVAWRALLSSPLEYALDDSGTVSALDLPPSVADAVLHELDLHATGERDPVALSAKWCARAHATKTIVKVL